MHLLTTQNAKTIKGEELGWLTGILYLGHGPVIADRASSISMLCPWSTPSCRRACLVTAGRGKFESVQRSRNLKTSVVLGTDSKILLRMLDKEVERIYKQATRRGLRACIRLNGTSDIQYHFKFPELFTKWSFIQFYDYTKVPFWGTGPPIGKHGLIPANYHLTYSARYPARWPDWHGIVFRDHAQVPPDDVNVAVVFSTPKGKPLPETFWGRPVIDGDLHDLRFLDPKGVIVGLRAKGAARYRSHTARESGLEVPNSFVVRV